MILPNEDLSGQGLKKNIQALPTPYYIKKYKWFSNSCFYNSIISVLIPLWVNTIGLDKYKSMEKNYLVQRS